MHDDVEDSAQVSEQLFRSIFENAQLGISFFNIARNAVCSNPAMPQILAYTDQNLS